MGSYSGIQRATHYSWQKEIVSIVDISDRRFKSERLTEVQLFLEFSQSLHLSDVGW